MDSVTPGLEREGGVLEGTQGRLRRASEVPHESRAPREIVAVGYLALSCLGAWLILVLVSPSVTRDELPRDPVLRFFVLFAFLLSSFLLGTGIRRIRRPALRNVAAVAFAGGTWFFLGSLLDVDHHLINHYGWPRSLHPYFHVSEVVAASVVVLAVLGTVALLEWPRKTSLRIPLMGFFAVCGSIAVLANLVAAASFFRWTPYRNLVAIATHVPWAWTVAGIVGIASFLILLGGAQFRAGRTRRRLSSTPLGRDEPPT